LDVERRDDDEEDDDYEPFIQEEEEQSRTREDDAEIGDWWAVRDSNPGLPACKAGALTN
jgi:hypothetical protein